VPPARVIWSSDRPFAGPNAHLDRCARTAAGSGVARVAIWRSPRCDGEIEAEALPELHAPISAALPRLIEVDDDVLLTLALARVIAGGPGSKTERILRRFPPDHRLLAIYGDL
jgi:hypothetical protein